MYVVQPEGKNCPVRTLHRDLLRPCGFLSVNEIESWVLQMFNISLEAADQEHSTSDQSESDDDSLHIRDSRRQFEFITNVLPSSGSPMVVKNLSGVEPIEPPPVVVNPVKGILPEAESCESPFAVVNPEKVTLPDTRLESTNNQQDNDNKNHLPVVNPADGVESGKDGNMAEVETSGRVVELDPVGDEDQSSDQTPPTKNVSSYQPVTDDDLGASGPRCCKRQCGPPNKLEYHKLGNPLTLVIQSLLQGLSSALTTSLEEPTSTSDQPFDVPGTFTTVVISPQINPAHARGCA